MNSPALCRGLTLCCWLAVITPVLAQGGSDPTARFVYEPGIAYKLALGFAALIFLAAIAKGGMDMARPKSPTAPPATGATWLGRLVPFVLAIFNLVVIIAVLTGLIADVRTLNAWVPLAGILALLQLLVILLAIRNPATKGMMKGIFVLMFLCALIALPLFLVQ